MQDALQRFTLSIKPFWICLLKKEVGTECRANIYWHLCVCVFFLNKYGYIHMVCMYAFMCKELWKATLETSNNCFFQRKDMDTWRVLKTNFFEFKNAICYVIPLLKCLPFIFRTKIQAPLIQPTRPTLPGPGLAQFCSLGSHHAPPEPHILCSWALFTPPVPVYW